MNRNVEQLPDEADRVMLVVMAAIGEGQQLGLKLGPPR